MRLALGLALMAGPAPLPQGAPTRSGAPLDVVVQALRASGWARVGVLERADTVRLLVAPRLYWGHRWLSDPIGRGDTRCGVDTALVELGFGERDTATALNRAPRVATRVRCGRP